MKHALLHTDGFCFDETVCRSSTAVVINPQRMRRGLRSVCVCITCRILGDSIILTLKTSINVSPEQLKQYRRQSHCIIKKGIFTPSYEPTKRTAAAKARAASRAMRRVPACCSVQYVQCQYSTVQEVRFFSTKKHNLLT